MLVFVGCKSTKITEPSPSNELNYQTVGSPSDPESSYTSLRLDMIQHQIKERGVRDPMVLKAMDEVPRHLFVPEEYKDLAYGDFPLSIGNGQTISQPYVVAFMTEQLQLRPTDRVLEVGTGSGYQAAVLAKIVKDVYTIEIIAELGKSAQTRLETLGFSNIHFRIGDGYEGWPEVAPFDAIMVTAAAKEIPTPLVKQLAVGGRMILPLERSVSDQVLTKVVKDAKGKTTIKELLGVLFVPLVHPRISK